MKQSGVTLDMAGNRHSTMIPLKTTKRPKMMPFSRGKGHRASSAATWNSKMSAQATLVFGQQKVGSREQMWFRKRAQLNHKRPSPFPQGRRKGWIFLWFLPESSRRKQSSATGVLRRSIKGHVYMRIHLAEMKVCRGRWRLGLFQTLPRALDLASPVHVTIMLNSQWCLLVRWKRERQDADEGLLLSLSMDKISM
jgi:hypothetical protein